MDNTAWKSAANTFLRVADGVVLTQTIDTAIAELDPWFSAEGVPATVTSGFRTAEKQLEVIVQKVLAHPVLKNEYPNIASAAVEDSASWLNAWGSLLTIGEMVNPPVASKAPFDYKKPDGSDRPAGTFIDISAHMKGHAFDIGLGALGPVYIKPVVDKAFADKSITDFKDYLFEPVNNAIHIDCVDTKLDGF